MKIGILSRRTTLYSTRRLREAAEERGHDVMVVDPLRCYMNIEAQRPQVVYRGEPLHFDAIVPRIGASITFYGCAVVRQFETTGAYTCAESQALARSRDKLHSMQLLSLEGIGVPVTGFARSSRDTQGLIDMVGGPPLIIKLLESTQGTGVVLAQTRKAAESVIGAFRQLDANILVQEFIQEAGGTDVRAFVVGGRVVASMERNAAPGEFRSNLHRGGTAAVVKLTRAERNTAIRAARTMGLTVAGVDLLRSSRGPLVMEVNASPGLEGIEKATGVDIAAEVIDYIESHAVEGDDVPPRSRRKVSRAASPDLTPADPDARPGPDAPEDDASHDEEEE
ncbi:MAG: 30S ribosomal protein S6--L-glutamate ligase [Longimicrobiales bacterium]|nr:30S ribosomal protein S6--L-glutamate ligase [Longimicrobiales bacterium]